MSFDTKKMIIAVIIVAVLFVLFLKYAFNNIQKVELEVSVLVDEEIDEQLVQTANEIISRYSDEYVDDISVEDIDMDILLINHEKKNACIIREQSAVAVDYGKLDKNIAYCNDFVVLIDNKKVLIVNCDEALDNAAARSIAGVYHYEYAAIDKLSPKNVEHFQSSNQDEMSSFYKYAMIESAKDAYFSCGKLDEFYYCYDQWMQQEGAEKYPEAVNYDFYDGFKAYVYAKVLADIDADFDMREHLDSFKNQYEIYSKDKEYAAMGMMWCLLMEKQGKNIISDKNTGTSMYLRLLEGVPQGSVDDEEPRRIYHEAFAQYIGSIEEIIEMYNGDITKIDPVSPIITTETYSGTIKIGDNHYIYADYYARDNEHNLLQCDYVAVEVSPYRIKYFFR